MDYLRFHKVKGIKQATEKVGGGHEVEEGNC
jgi:hypothetical protein